MHGRGPDARLQVDDADAQVQISCICAIASLRVAASIEPTGWNLSGYALATAATSALDTEPSTLELRPTHTPCSMPAAAISSNISSSDFFLGRGRRLEAQLPREPVADVGARVDAGVGKPMAGGRRRKSMIFMALYECEMVKGWGGEGPGGHCGSMRASWTSLAQLSTSSSMCFAERRRRHVCGFDAGHRQFSTVAASARLACSACASDWATLSGMALGPTRPYQLVML